MTKTAADSSNPSSTDIVSKGKPGRRRLPRLRVVIVATAMVGVAGGVWQYLWINTEPADVRYVAPEDGHVMYLPTPQDVVERMLEIAEVSADDMVYDLGCGDGRVVVTAATIYGCQGRGYDIDPLRVRDSRENAKK